MIKVSGISQVNIVMGEPEIGVLKYKLKAVFEDELWKAEDIAQGLLLDRTKVPTIANETAVTMVDYEEATLGNLDNPQKCSWHSLNQGANDSKT